MRHKVRCRERAGTCSALRWMVGKVLIPARASQSWRWEEGSNLLCPALDGGRVLRLALQSLPQPIRRLHPFLV